MAKNNTLQTEPLKPETLSTNLQLATKIGIESAKRLTWLTRNKSKHYKTYKIPKKAAGKYRIIHDPDSLIRVIQYKILTKILNEIDLPRYLWAFEKRKSIPQMANLHTSKAVVLSFDIKDFFTSITNRMIIDKLSKYNITDKAATTVSELCTFKYFVPQGALTSPKISNIITANTFGPDVFSYCESKGLTLSIYADDITISSSEKLDWAVIHEIMNTIRSCVRQHGFRLNQNKTKVMFHDKRQWVCGAVVNEKVNMLRKDRNNLRAMVHNVMKNGYEAECSKMDLSPTKFYEHLRGRLNWFLQLNPDSATILVDKLKTVPIPE